MKRGRMELVAGPTAVGKTEKSLQLAEELGAVILSCDSLCFYRGMDIGTAKPTVEEQSRVPHYGIDLVEASERYSVDRYLAYRAPLLERWREEGRPVVVVGGSGFYLQSFLAPVVDRLDIPPAVAREVAQLRNRGGASAVAAELRRLHGPEESFRGLDWQNPRRVEKALIRCLASGRGYGQLRAEFEALGPALPEWDKRVRLLDREDGEWEERNRARVDLLLRSGLVEETRRLREAGFEANPSACGAIGYRETLAYLDGHVSGLDELAELIVVHTRQLRRKQQKWFRSRLGGAERV